MASPFSSSFLLAFTALLAAATFSSAQVEYGYSGLKGPEKWGSLSPKYAVCSSGKSQSPIDIVKDKVVPNKNLKPLTRDYHPEPNATLVNDGHGVAVQFEENAGTLKIDGKSFTLKEIHWHCPSEHRIDGELYPAELHIVHKAKDGSISVVGILFKLGDEDPLLSKVKDNLKELANENCEGDEEAHIAIGDLDTKDLRKKTRKYYRYIGSLTSPPCTENVIWSILGKVRTISKEQVAALKAPLDLSVQKNARPLQPLKGRKVELYSEEDSDD